LSVLSPHGLGQFLSTHRQGLLIVLSVLELLILMAVLLRWYNRKYGLRRAAARIRRACAEAGRDLIAPILAAIRFRQGVRLVATRLAEADPATVHDTLASTRAALAERPESWPYLMMLGSRDLTVGIAGPDPAPIPDPDTSPWRVSAERRWSTAIRPAPFAPVEADEATPVPVAVGVTNDELVLLDLARSPGIISVHGATGPADRLVRAMAVQLTAVLFGPVETIVQDAILKSAGSKPLSEALAELARRPAGAQPRTVLVCSQPEESDVARLTDLAERDPGLLVVVAGYVPGSRWRLRVTSAGRVVAPELGVDADSAPLWRGLERLLATPPAGPSMNPTPSRPIWADEETPAASPTPPAELLPPEPGPAVHAAAVAELGPAGSGGDEHEPTAANDLIEPASAGPAPRAQSGADNDAASTRSGVH
jgi:hypothetical protein